MRMALQHAAPDSAPPAQRPAIQMKARIGPVDDPLEREADRVADAVVSDRPIGVMGGGAPGAAQCKCAQCDAGEKDTLRRKSESGGGAAPVQAASTAEAAAVVSSGGTPLTPRERVYFEPRFGRDLSDVRIHTNDEASAAAGSIHARAFALGRNIAFARGEYRPDTVMGQHLTAHELAHVVQGAHGADPHVIRRGPGDRPDKVAPEIRIVSDVWSVADANGVSRSVVIVESGGERQAFYERSGVSERPEGHAGPKAGDWAPFDGFKDNGKGFGHFEKDLYFRGKMPNDPRYGYGDRKNIQISEWLRDERLPKPIPEHWTYVQSRLQSRGVHVLTPLDTPIPERLAPVKPPARTAGGEITTRTPGGPGGGGGPANKPSVIVSPSAASSRSTVEYLGAPVEPIRNPANFGAKAAHEGGALALLSMQLGNIRGMEAEKAATRLNELLGQADALLSKGYGVGITLVMEVPDTIDLAAAIAGIGDASQVVYFNRMFISQIDTPPTTQTPSKYPVMRENLAPGDPMQENPHERTLDQQIRGQMYEKYPVEKYRPRKYFHFETRELRLGGQPPDTNKNRLGNLPAFGRDFDYEAAEIRARPPAYVGTYRPDTVDQSSVGGRFQSMVAVGMHRLVQFHAAPAKSPGFVEMWNMHYGNGKTKYQTEWTSGTGPSTTMSARFVEKADGKVYSFVESTFAYVPNPYADAVLIENASGGEASSNAYNWSAVITWKRVDKAG